MSRPFAPRLRVSTYLSDWMPSGDTHFDYAGYALGGYAPNQTAEIRKFNHSTESLSILSATLTAQRRELAGLSSTTKGYAAAGMNAGALVAAYDALTFSSETRTSLAAVMATNRFYPGGASNFSVAGYVAGGTTATVTTTGHTADIEKFTYATEASSVSVASLALTAFAPGNGSQNSGVAGYFTGGMRTYSPEVYNANMFKIAFATDTTSSPTSMSVAQYNVAMVSDNGTAVYMISGGNAGGPIAGTPVYKVPFATDTLATTAMTCPAQGNLLITSNQIMGAGYFIGTATSRKITYATDTLSTPSITVSQTFSWNGVCDFNGVT